MAQKTFLNSTVKLILVISILFLTGFLQLIVGNPIKVITSTLLPVVEFKKTKISIDSKAIVQAETKEPIFTIEDTQKYLKNYSYEYNPDTFQNTNAKYEGECFSGAALSGAEDRIVFSVGCLSGDLPQGWIGIYSYYTDYCPLNVDCDVAPQEDRIKFLIGGIGKKFVWSADNETITYEAELGLSGMTETRTIDSVTGDILEISN